MVWHVGIDRPPHTRNHEKIVGVSGGYRRAVVEGVCALNNHLHRCHRRIRGGRLDGEVVGRHGSLGSTYHPTPEIMKKMFELCVGTEEQLVSNGP